MTSITVQSTNSKAQDSRLLMSSFGGGIARVASVSATTVTVDASDFITGKSLFATTTPGMMVVIEGVATSDHGKTSNLTWASGNEYATGTNLSAAVADGDYVLIIPPLSIEVFTNGGHSLTATANDDETRGLTETFLTHRTRLDTPVGGDIPFFLFSDTEGVGRLLMAGIGGYNKSGSGIHDYTPLKASSATTDVSDFCLYSKDGNGVINQVFFGLFGTQLVLDFPQQGRATGTLSVLGAGAVREIGGSGKTFPSGSNSWIPSTIDCDIGSSHVFQGVMLELGGSFGDALSDSVDRFFQSATVTVTRGAVATPTLGNQFIMKPIEETFGVTVTGTRVLEDDALFDKSWGQTTDAEPGIPQTTRLLLVATDPSSSSRTLTIDMPKGKFRAQEVTRQNGRFVQPYTFTGIQTLDADGCVATATPLLRIRLNSGDNTNYATAL